MDIRRDEGTKQADVPVDPAEFARVTRSLTELVRSLGSAEKSQEDQPPTRS
jgi:hypothetical protein